VNHNCKAALGRNRKIESTSLLLYVNAALEHRDLLKGASHETVYAFFLACLRRSRPVRTAWKNYLHNSMRYRPYFCSVPRAEDLSKVVMLAVHQAFLITCIIEGESLTEDPIPFILSMS
jgi:hypothetical protein